MRIVMADVLTWCRLGNRDSPRRHRLIRFFRPGRLIYIHNYPLIALAILQSSHSCPGHRVLQDPAPIKRVVTSAPQFRVPTSSPSSLMHHSSPLGTCISAGSTPTSLALSVTCFLTRSTMSFCTMLVRRHSTGACVRGLNGLQMLVPRVGRE
ncbi:hypothetical protein PspLS_10251 [Pyricularia sp. CBS 133598]|nr:hypothetical protein PspLS_10251 [Pyricularia sp. CBS 133598]